MCTGTLARGAGERPALRLLEALGCTVTHVDVERESEPVPRTSRRSARP